MIKPIPTIPIYGTFAGDFTMTTDPCPDESHWWHQHSAWWNAMASFGCATFRQDRDFVWTGELDGIWSKLWNVLRFRPKEPPTHRQWLAGGDALADYVTVGISQGQTPRQFLVVAHSHGGQVALYAAARGLYIPILITVSTPHRLDMRPVAALARPNIGFWLHLYDPDGDKVAQEGALFDGGFNLDRTFKGLADLNFPVKHHDHSNLLRNPALYPLWPETIFPLIEASVDAWT